MALMLLDDARREARFAGGELVLLADQDRSRWDTAKITRGRARAFFRRRRGDARAGGSLIRAVRGSCSRWRTRAG
jgi:predicted RNA polymerase sigma factor